MTRFIHMTDLHLSPPAPGDELLHTDTQATLEAVLDRVSGLTPAAEFVILGGDLVNHGTRDNYRLLKEMLDPLQMPIIPAMGNHDDRAAFREVFGAALDLPGEGEAPLFLEVVQDGLHVIVLDSSVPGHVSGAIEQVQFAALERALRVHPELPKLLVCHHPPYTGRAGTLPWESLNAEDSTRLAHTIEGHPVIAILCGHVHMNRVMSWHGVPVIINIGLHATVDTLALHGMTIEEGNGFALCLHDVAGFEATFVPHDPPRKVLAEIDESVLRRFR